MKTLYFECKMGAAGDMLQAALFELLNEKQKAVYLNTMNHLLGDAISVSAEAGRQCGIAGTHMRVKVLGVEEGCAHEHSHSHGDDHDRHAHSHGHEHYSYLSLCEKIDTLPLSTEVQAHTKAVYRLIGEAEAKVHRSDLEHIHFHEVGSLDALADVAGCCLLLSMLRPEQVIVSPIHVGNGLVKCAHGILPVPAPATAEILMGVPYYTGDIRSELCTPTGAAILKHFADSYGPMPVMTVSGTGFGLGTKEFPAANGVRVFLGETSSGVLSDEYGLTDEILEISCNLDDMTGEEMGFAMEILMAAGALDVYYQNIYMKKNRPGVILSCLCKPSEKEHFTKLIFKYTTTRGVRYTAHSRAKLDVRFEEADTRFGVLRKKVSFGYGIEKSKYEYEDLRNAALREGCSIADILAELP